MLCRLKLEYTECQYCLREQAENGIIYCECCKWHTEEYEVLYITDKYARIAKELGEYMIPKYRLIIGEEKKYKN